MEGEKKQMCTIIILICEKGGSKYSLEVGETREKTGQIEEEVMTRLRMMFRSFNFENSSMGILCNAVQ